MLAFLKELRTKITIGMVGGSDLSKQREQLGDGGESRPTAAAHPTGRANNAR